MNNIFRIWYYHLYLLQLEEYETGRFWKTLTRKGFTPKQDLRKEVDWTLKAKMLTLTSWLLVIIIGTFFAVAKLYIFLIALVFSAIYMHFAFLIAALWLLTPVDLLLKYLVIQKGTAHLKKYPNLKIIGIAGSYGKTTMKEVLYTLLSEKFNVVKTPGNINTPIGISRYVRTHISDETDIFLMEMGEYYQGDISQICEMATPDIAVVTGINEAHLERMGDIETTARTIFEVVEGSKSDAIIALNADDKRVEEHAHKYIKRRHAIWYGVKKSDKSHYKAVNVRFRPDASGLTFDIEIVGESDKNKHLLHDCHVSLLGEYVIGDIIGALQIGLELGMVPEQIKTGIAMLQPVEHRLQPIHNNTTNILVIDDSYNGNPEGVTEAIQVLSHFKTRRKIYLTPGLVETGEKNEQVHYNIGTELADVADLVILIKNSATPFIKKGLLHKKFKEENIVEFDSAQEAHKSLATVLKSNDVILFQNDWPDNYS